MKRNYNLAGIKKYLLFFFIALFSTSVLSITIEDLKKRLGDHLISINSPVMQSEYHDSALNFLTTVISQEFDIRQINVYQVNEFIMHVAIVVNNFLYDASGNAPEASPNDPSNTLLLGGQRLRGVLRNTPFLRTFFSRAVSLQHPAVSGPRQVLFPEQGVQPVQFSLNQPVPGQQLLLLQHPHQQPQFHQPVMPQPPHLLPVYPPPLVVNANLVRPTMYQLNRVAAEKNNFVEVGQPIGAEATQEETEEAKMLKALTEENLSLKEQQQILKNEIDQDKREKTINEAEKAEQLKQLAEQIKQLKQQQKDLEDKTAQIVKENSVKTEQLKQLAEQTEQLKHLSGQNDELKEQRNKLKREKSKIGKEKDRLVKENASLKQQIKDSQESSTHKEGKPSHKGTNNQQKQKESSSHRTSSDREVQKLMGERERGEREEQEKREQERQMLIAQQKAKEKERKKREQEELALEKAEAEKKQQEKLAREKAEAEKKQQEKLAREKAEAEKKQQEKLAREKAEAEKKQQEKLAREKAEAEKKQQEKLAREKVAAEKKQQDELARKQAEAEKKQQEKLAREKVAAEKKRQDELARKQAEADKKQQEKLAREKAAAERKRQKELARKQAAAERKRQEDLARKKAEDQKKREQDELAQKQAEAERARQEELDRKQAEEEKKRQDELAREQAKQENEGSKQERTQDLSHKTEQTAGQLRTVDLFNPRNTLGSLAVVSASADPSRNLEKELSGLMKNNNIKKQFNNRNAAEASSKSSLPDDNTKPSQEVSQSNQINSNRRQMGEDTIFVKYGEYFLAAWTGVLFLGAIVVYHYINSQAKSDTDTFGDQCQPFLNNIISNGDDSTIKDSKITMKCFVRLSAGDLIIPLYKPYIRNDEDGYSDFILYNGSENNNILPEDKFFLAPDKMEKMSNVSSNFGGRYAELLSDIHDLLLNKSLIDGLRITNLSAMLCGVMPIINQTKQCFLNVRDMIESNGINTISSYYSFMNFGKYVSDYYISRGNVFAILPFWEIDADGDLLGKRYPVKLQKNSYRPLFPLFDISPDEFIDPYTQGKSFFFSKDFAWVRHTNAFLSGQKTGLSQLKHFVVYESSPWKHYARIVGYDDGKQLSLLTEPDHGLRESHAEFIYMFYKRYLASSQQVRKIPEELRAWFTSCLESQVCQIPWFRTDFTKLDNGHYQRVHKAYEIKAVSSDKAMRQWQKKLAFVYVAANLKSTGLTISQFADEARKLCGVFEHYKNQLACFVELADAHFSKSDWTKSSEIIHYLENFDGHSPQVAWPINGEHSVLPPRVLTPL
ncbi:hypothetical protein [Endozoicomonas lisbonensis]|uniref:Uncharacterized protein n=1 Tax=Endozoicomonas lisbonensis TaxID=3120522 RepID=A0ABV2SKN6_9GAMM